MDITWDDVPVHGQQEPLPVLVETHVWRKIGERHMAEPQEPWDEWMQPNLVSDFRSLWPSGCLTEADRGTIEKVSDHIRQDVLASLSAPLLMTYSYRRLGSFAATAQHGTRSVREPEPTQRLVLPNGAHAEIRRAAGGTWSLRTCYFEDDVAGRGTPQWQRYRRLVGKWRARYVRSPCTVGADEIVDPYLKLKEETVETGIEFVSRTNWGLDSPTPADPWNHLPTPWPQPPALPAVPPPGLLNPRSPGRGTTT